MNGLIKKAGIAEGVGIVVTPKGTEYINGKIAEHVGQFAQDGLHHAGDFLGNLFHHPPSVPQHITPHHLANALKNAPTIVKQLPHAEKIHGAIGHVGQGIWHGARAGGHLTAAHTAGAHSFLLFGHTFALTLPNVPQAIGMCAAAVGPHLPIVLGALAVTAVAATAVVCAVALWKKFHKPKGESISEDGPSRFREKAIKRPTVAIEQNGLDGQENKDVGVGTVSNNKVTALAQTGGQGLDTQKVGTGAEATTGTGASRVHQHQKRNR